jgi:putative PIN family toxin of toxin-antitoxin system
MAKVVFDTNVLISGFLWGGLPGQALNCIFDERARLLTSTDLTNELRITLSRPKFAKRLAALNRTPSEYLMTFEKMAYRVQSVEVPSGIIRDPKDRIVLGCAVGGQADCIVSGDRDLLVLESYETIPIWTVAHFLTQIESLE